MEIIQPHKCFIFDLDGTLVFNEEANYLAYEATFAQVGIDMSREQYGSYFGLGIEDMLAEHAKQTGKTYDENLLKRVKEVKSVEYAKRLHLIEQNAAVVGILRAVAPHYPTALATTAREQNARAVLDEFGLTSLFGFMVFGEQVTKKKPDPECHQLIAQHFAVKPEECLIFEDSDTGIAAAKAFGGHLFKVVA